MTSYDDGLLAAQFAALAPEPLEGRWDDLLRDAAAARDDSSRLNRSTLSRVPRRYLVAFVAAVLVAAIGTAAYGTVRVLVLDQGFIGLPPVGATPSSPESSDLVVQSFAFAPPLSGQQDGKADMVRAWVYADGRIIWDRRPHDPGGRGIPEGANEFNSGYLEQRLAPEGVELVRAAAAELLDQSRALVEEIPVGEDPWWRGDHPPRLALLVPKDFGSEWGVLAVPHGDESARLYWKWETNDFVRETAATPEQLSALGRVVALLNVPASVLPASAWAVGKVRAYVPSHYAVCIDTLPSRPASELLSTLPERAADVLRDKRATFPPEGGPFRSVDDCFEVSTDEAREIAEALAGLAWDENGIHGLRFHLDKTVDGQPAEWNEVSIEPYFPDGRIPFSAAFG